MKKDRETASKYRQQALEGDLMAMNNMGVCYAVLWRIMPTDLVTDGHRVAHIKEGISSCLRLLQWDVLPQVLSERFWQFHRMHSVPPCMP